MHHPSRVGSSFRVEAQTIRIPTPREGIGYLPSGPVIFFRPPKLRISADVRRHADWIQTDAELGFEEIYLHHVGPHPDRFIREFGEKVLPGLVV